MKILPILSVSFAGMLAAGCVSNQAPAEVRETVTGMPVLLDHARAECNQNTAPSFEQIVNRGIVKHSPANGKLSAGKAGIRRGSRSCGKDVPNREILYTPNPGFVGEDTTTLWNTPYKIIVHPK